MSEFKHGETLEDYLNRAHERYNKWVIGQNWAKSMSENIAHMRSMGYNIIVLGDTVKVTFKKEDTE